MTRAWVCLPKLGQGFGAGKGMYFAGIIPDWKASLFPPRHMSTRKIYTRPT